jgi:hypothetical protein
LSLTFLLAKAPTVAMFESIGVNLLNYYPCPFIFDRNSNVVIGHAVP